MKTIPARGFFLGWALIALASFAGGQVLFKIGGPHTDSGQHVVVDDDGNIFIAGCFQGTVDFDPGPETARRTASGDPADPLTGQDAVDIFLAKYDPAGKFLWVVTLGDEGPDKPLALDLDPEGHVVLAGRFFLDGEGRTRTFIAKYDGDGALLWVFELDPDGLPPSDDEDAAFEPTLALSAASNGHIAVTGSFRGTIDLDPSGKAGTDAVFTSDSGSSDAFIAVYSSLGEFRWGKALGSPGEDQGRAVRMDAEGRIVVAGLLSGDLFVVKFDASGEILWESRAGGSGSIQVASGALALDNAGSILLTGEFSRTADFDSERETPPLIARGESDIFTAKYATDGDFLWAVGAGSVYHDFGTAVAVDKNGNVFVTGSFSGATDFDPGEKENILIPKGGPEVGDIFLVKYDPEGKCLWARSFGGPENDPDSLQAGWGLAVDGRGNAFVTGRFHLSADFDPGPSSEFLTSDGCADVFLTQFDGDGELVAARLRHPPLQFRGYKYLNRSLSQFEYINILIWSRNPGDPGAVSFRIYLVVDGVRSLETEIDVSSTTYWHRNVARDKSYHYICTAVDVWGNEGGTAEIVVR
ncbi:MAG: SBBP repeat-containing protein [Acidobacteriota bacterium]|nr:SBBP repeat-containing protein [Acidobacteriota bacterium]